MKKTQFITKIILLVFDFFLCFFSFLTSYYLRQTQDSFLSFNFFHGYIPEQSTYLPFVFYVSVLLVFVFYLGGVYSVGRYTKHTNITKLIFVWVLLISSYFFWVRILFFSRFVLVFGVFLTYFSILIFRILIDYLLKTKALKKYFQKELVLVGLNSLNKTVLNIFIEGDDYKVLENFNTTEKKRLSGIKTFIEENKIKEILQTDVGDDKEFDLKLLDFCQLEGITYKFIPNLFDIHKQNITTDFISKYPILELNQTPLSGWKRVLKRLFDILFALTALIILTPVFIIVSIAIKITSKGSVFVSLERIRYKEVFKLYKFRSMVQNAHRQKINLKDQNERKDGPLFKMKNDPRITKLGKILRRTRIDELPQFLNVLKGDMSIVGPRPHEPEEVQEYKKHHRKLLSIKPGLTGMAQVSGASDLSFEEEVRLDTYYIESWSVVLDIKIILKTIWVVFTCKGAS